MPRFGQVLSGRFPFGELTLPLPLGSWRVVAVIPVNRPDGVTFDQLAFARQDGNILTGLIFVTGNGRMPSAYGFRADGNCERTDLDYANVIENSDLGAQDCQTIDYVPVEIANQPNADQLTRAAFGELKQEGSILPSTVIGPMFRFGDMKRVLIMKIYFNPDHEGISPTEKAAWPESDWNKYNIEKFQAKRAYLERLKAWIGKWEPILRAAWLKKAPTKTDDANLLSLP